MTHGMIENRSGATRKQFLKLGIGAICATALVGRVRADTPIVRIAASRGVVSAPIWNIANHATQHGFSVQMSVLFTYADQQRACRNGETASATTGINNPAIIADQGIANVKFVAGQQFGGQNLILRKGAAASNWKDLEGKTIRGRSWYLRPGSVSCGSSRGRRGFKQNQHCKRFGGCHGTCSAPKRRCRRLRAICADDRSGRSGRDWLLSIKLGYWRLLGPANGGILANTDFLANKELAVSFMKAYVASVHEMQQEDAFVKVATQLAGITPEVARESFKNMYFSEIVDTRCDQEGCENWLPVRLHQSRCFGKNRKRC